MNGRSAAVRATLRTLEVGLTGLSPDDESIALAETQVIFVRRVTEMAKRRPDLAGRLIAAMWATVSGLRPELTASSALTDTDGNRT